MDKYALKGAKYYKNEGITLDERLKELEKNIDGKRVYTSDGKFSMYDVAKVLSNGVHPINLTVLRDGKTIELNLIIPDEKGIMVTGLEQSRQ